MQALLEKLARGEAAARAAYAERRAKASGTLNDDVTRLRAELARHARSRARERERARA